MYHINLGVLRDQRVRDRADPTLREHRERAARVAQDDFEPGVVGHDARDEQGHGGAGRGEREVDDGLREEAADLVGRDVGLAGVQEDERGEAVKLGPDGTERLIADQPVAVRRQDDDAVGPLLDLEHVPDLRKRPLDVVEVRQAREEAEAAFSLSADFPDLVVQGTRELSALFGGTKEGRPGSGDG